MHKKKLIFIGLIVVFCIGMALRFYRLSEYPIGFHGDEASLVYNGYSILKTGKDENGKFFPIHSSISQTYRPIGYTYLTITPIALFGLTEFSARFPGALLGSLTVLLLFYLALFIYKNHAIALISAGLLAINPWHINMSRASAESLAALFFLLLGVYYFLLTTYAKKKIFLYSVLTLLSTLASFIVYQSPRIVLPIMFMLIIVSVVLKTKNWFKIKIPLLVFICVVILDALLIFGTEGGTIKFQDVGILHSVETRAVLEEAIREDGPNIPSVFVRFYHNKLKALSATFFDQYFKYYTYDYLFQGNILPIRYYIHQSGLLHMAELPLILIGVFFIISNMKRPYYWIPLAFLLVGPTAAALTWEDTPNALRSLPMVIAFPLLSAYSLYYLYRRIYGNMVKGIFVSGVVLVFLYSVIYYQHQYYVHAMSHRPWYREYGFKELVQELKPLRDEYDYIIFTKAYSGAYVHLLFHMKYDPASYIMTDSVRDQPYKGFDKYIFVPHDCPSPENLSGIKEFPQELLAKRNLYVSKGNCEDGDLVSKELATIYFPDKNPVFKLREYIMPEEL